MRQLAGFSKEQCRGPARLMEGLGARGRGGVAGGAQEEDERGEAEAV